jgi:hypothetical protein
VSNDNVFKLVQPGAFDDQLIEILPLDGKRFVLRSSAPSRRQPRPAPTMRHVSLLDKVHSQKLTYTLFRTLSIVLPAERHAM